MKKMLKYASLSAIAFVGAVSFSACSSSNDVAEDINPNYNPETNAVKTEFVINVTQPGERTRMTAANAGAGDFQGINNMNLFCYSGATATINSMDAAHKMTLTSYDTPTLSGDNTTGSSKVYTMYIPVGTTNFLFYATALSSITDKFAQGSLGNNLASATTVLTTPTAAETDIKFNLESIVPTTSSSTITTPQGYLTTILNDIKDAQVDNTHTWAGTHGATGNMTALGNAFDQFTNQAHSGDVRQGSSLAIKHMVKDLFDAVYEDYNLHSEVDVRTMGEAVLDKIALYFDVTKTGDASPYTYTWNDAYKTGTDGATFNTASYPESQNLPSGSAVIVYDNTNGFSYINDGTHGAAAVTTAYDKFTYPSQLTYYCNSGLWQTATGKTSSDYPTSSSTWLSYDWNTNGWNGNAVNAGTRAVAMKDNITYGAAQLVSTIQLGSGVGTTTENALIDNASTVTGGVVSDNVFDASTTAKTIKLYVHGILIGGQPATSVYNYLPYNDNVADVIYDRFSNGTEVTETGVQNYTLAMDNYTTAEAQATVNIALEMTADKEFYGISGKIKPGQKFYLIGSLDPTAGGSITWTDHKSFKSGDTGYNKNRVFIRDAKTVATFTLKKNTLKNAYSTIPDLRSTQMVFGISVDLAWKAGLTFNVNLGQ